VTVSNIANTYSMFDHSFTLLILLHTILLSRITDTKYTPLEINYM